MFSFFKKKASDENDVVVVLGMHRSGTSCLTGILQEMGVDLGDVVESAPFNKKGNRESLGVMALNDEVLAYNDGSWDVPIAELSWSDKHRRKRDKLISMHSGSSIWGFKDPRVLFTLPFWMEGLGKHRVHFIGTFRNPLAVANSLNARQPEFSVERGIDLWASYTSKFIEYHKRYSFPVVNFDLSPNEYLNSVVEAVKGMGVLPEGSAEKLEFFDSSLRHQSSEPKPDTDEVREKLESVKPMYEYLLSIK